MPHFARLRHCVELPDFLAGLSVKRHGFAAEPGVGRRADDDKAADIERRARHALPAAA